MYSRVIPPGASGYQFNTDIKETEVNGEIDDIGLALTNSITKNGTTTATADLPMGGFVHTGLGQANANGETVRFEALKKGSDIAVIANGTVAIPAEGALFNLTAASAFNVTGFTGGYDGRTYSVRFNPDKLLTLVNSSAFKLLGGATRTTRAGEIIHFVQESSGVIAEIGQQPIIDLTGYSGADIALGIGQAAIYDVTAATAIALRIATGDNQEYELTINPDYTASAVFGAAVNLLQNNAATTTTIINQQSYGTVSTTVSQGGVGATYLLALQYSLHKLKCWVSTKTTSKNTMSTFVNRNGATASFAGVITSNNSDTTTVWNSLGTINCNAMTGRIMVKRVM